MPKRAVLKVVKVNYTPSAPWMVRVPEQLQKIEAAKKKFFRRESVAKAYAERLARQLGDYHTQALGLSDRQKLEASECYRLLEGHNASLFEVVHHFLRYCEHAKRSVPLGELFTEFLAIKEQDNASRRYMADLRSKVGRFVAAHENRLTCDVTAADVEHWIRSLDIGSVSRESYRRNLSTFLEFGRRRGYSRINPAADIKIRRRPEGEVTILTPDEVSTLLEKCASEIVPYVAICTFAGLRPSEAAALDWADIHLDSCSRCSSGFGMAGRIGCRREILRPHQFALQLSPVFTAWWKFSCKKGQSTKKRRMKRSLGRSIIATSILLRYSHNMALILGSSISIPFFCRAIHRSCAGLSPADSILNAIVIPSHAPFVTSTASFSGFT